MATPKCLFCSIVDQSIPSRVIWEDEHHLAVLTPFPNTAGFTVLLTKEHLPSDILELADTQLNRLANAARGVAELLKTKLGVVRVGLIFEGYGINHAHAKLVPMHGIPAGEWKPILSDVSERRFYDAYPGFISSHDGPKMIDDDLEKIFKQIVG